MESFAAPAATSKPRQQQGEETRRAILKAAMDVASARGLEGLTIGDLAKELGMSKSGLFAHFGSKEELQIATIEAAEKVFAESVIKPVRDKPEGWPRLAALLESFLKYAEGSVFPGGCFFAAVSAEYDTRPGRIRDRIAQSIGSWRELLEKEVRKGQESEAIDPSIEPAQLVFELRALLQEANYSHQLLREEGMFDRARRAIRNRLLAAATDEGRGLLSE